MTDIAPTPRTPALTLPSTFSWGVAASAHQIEGAAAEGGRSPSIWDTFSHTEGKTARGQHADVACDHYHRVAEDVAIMADLGVETYRFSLSWSRLIPSGDGEVNPDGVAFYRHLCELLGDAGITPLVALYHWDLPQVLQDRGGWDNPESVEWFVHYAGTAKRALSDLASDWLTINEPYCAAFLGHGSGVHAPGITDPGTAFVAAHHMLLAHHRAVATMRDTTRHEEDQFTIALNLIPARGQDPDGADDDAAAAVDLIHSQMFLDGVLEGRYPDTVLDLHRRFGVDGRIDPADLATAHEPIDWLGINYYNVTHVIARPGTPAPAAYPGADGAVLVGPPGPQTDMGWGIEPDGLAEILRRVGSAYPDLPLVVSENGAAFPDEVSDDGRVHDPQRVAFLADHLQVIVDAIAEGIDVRGYHVWSLLDNFEWALGYDMRFGLVRVDPETLARTPKDSAHWYADVIAAHRQRSGA